MMRLKHFVSMLMLLCGIHGSQAQTQFDNIQHKIHKKAEINMAAYVEGGYALSIFSPMKGAGLPELGTRSGCVFEGGLQLRFLQCRSVPYSGHKLLGARIGIAYTLSGFKFKENGTKVSLSDISFPMYIQVYPIRRMFVEAGPEFTINAGIKPDYIYSGNVGIDLTGHKANDIKLGIGVGYHWRLFGIHARYLFGTSSFAANLPWKGSQLKIGAFVRFGLNSSRSATVKINL